MRLIRGLLLLPLLGGCAGYAIDYVRPRTQVFPAEQFSRYGLSAAQAQCVGDRLRANLSVWQLRQLADVTAAATRGQGGALSPRDFVAVSSNVTDPRVPREVAATAEACRLLAPGTAADPAPAPAPEAAPVAPPPGSVNALPAASTAWVNLGAAATGQAIAVEAASVRQDGGSRRAWFRLTNPGQSTAAVSYLLQIDCTGRTINPMGFRQYGQAGTVVAEREYGPTGEGAITVEAGTVMEIAYLALCT